jgi:TolB-like protein
MGAHRGDARRGPALALVVTAAMLTGCGASRQVVRPTTAIPSHSRVAVLPLEDLSGDPAAAVGFTRMVYAELVRTGSWEVPETGIVEQAMDSLAIRNGGSLRADQVQALGQRLKVEYLLTGTLLESGMVKTGDGEVPAVGAALKLIEVATNRALWALVKFRTGEDRETVFGWGRERNPQMLAGSLAQQMIADFMALTGDSTKARGGK